MLSFIRKPIVIYILAGILCLAVLVGAWWLYNNQSNDSNSNQSDSAELERQPVELPITEEDEEYVLVDSIKEEQAEISKENPDDSSKFLVVYGEYIIREHNTRDDCWIVLSQEVFDISNWEYPGESDISEACGKTNGQDYFEADGLLKEDDDGNKYFTVKPPSETYKGSYNTSGYDFTQ